MLQKYPLVSRFALFLLLPSLIVIAWLIHQQTANMIDSGETVIVEAPTAKVSVNVDHYGVPYIKSKNDNDAFFAMGYLHAQNRLWQLEIQRRIVRGRLSEIFGQSTLDQDIWFRTFGLIQAAKSSWASLDKDAQDSLTSYAQGINTWIESTTTLPPEFSLLGVKPEHWTVFDSLGWIKVFALNLSGNHQEEIEHLLAANTLTPQELKLFFPLAQNAPSVQQLTNNDLYQAGLKIHSVNQALTGALGLGHPNSGSNAWVVSGKLLKSGNSLLANDPHLGIQIPSIWYAANIDSDRLKVTGMTLVGLPIVLFGRNENISWGGTNLMADVQDLYIEQSHPNDFNLYRQGEDWVPYQHRVETIIISPEAPAKFRAPVKPKTIKIRATNKGPVISDTYQLFESPVSLQWTALTPEDKSYQGFFRANYAKDWPSFRLAFKDYVAPALNLLYADNHGNIGAQTVGKIPIRKQGIGYKPVIGWQQADNWQGYIPFDELPRQYNPEKGYIVSANNKIIDDDYPYFISSNWAPDARANRIAQLIESAAAKGKIAEPQYSMSMQTDNLSLDAQRLLPLLAQVKGSNEIENQAIKAIAAWNGEMGQDSVAASIFFVWMKHLRTQLFLDDIKQYANRGQIETFLKSMVRHFPTERIHQLLSNNQKHWCNDKTTKPLETCETILASSLSAAVKELTKLISSDLHDWQWGEIHKIKYGHMPFSHFKVLNALFEREIPGAGDTDTINVASPVFQSSKGYQSTFGAGFRQIILWQSNHAKTHWYINSTGQSGNLFSPHYDDMLEYFYQGQYLELNNRPVTQEHKG